MTGTVPKPDGFISVWYLLTSFTAEPPWKANKSVRFGGGVSFVVTVHFLRTCLVLLPVHTFSRSLFGILAGLTESAVTQQNAGEGRLPQSKQGLPVRRETEVPHPRSPDHTLVHLLHSGRGGQPPQPFSALVTLVKKIPPTFWVFFSSQAN